MNKSILLATLMLSTTAWGKASEALNQAVDNTYKERESLSKTFKTIDTAHDLRPAAARERSIEITVGDEFGGYAIGNARREDGFDFRDRQTEKALAREERQEQKREAREMEMGSQRSRFEDRF